MFIKEGWEGSIRIPSGCAVAGIIDRSGKTIGGAEIVKTIAVMRERSNGLGGGFAGYGIYPGLAGFYALHLLFLDHAARAETEESIGAVAHMEMSEPIPTRTVAAIAEESGFVDDAHLRRHFGKRYGCSPMEYRKRFG